MEAVDNLMDGTGEKDTIRGKTEGTGSGTGQEERVWVINPGSTSMKWSVFRGERSLLDEEISCDLPVPCLAFDRKRVLTKISDELRERLNNAYSGPLDSISARGGFLPRPEGKLKGGTYILAERKGNRIFIHEDMVRGVTENPERHHACNWGIPLAANLALKLGIPAFVVDPVVVDEFWPEAELSGVEGIVRRSAAHALSVKEAAREAAQRMGSLLQDLCLVVAHLGGGITVAAIREGRMVDNNIALLGGGPYTPQRVGSLPMGELIDLCFRQGSDRETLIRALTKRGGLQSYLGEHRMDRIEQRIAEGDARARLVVEGMLYQTAKEIGAQFVAAGCDVDAIVLTGGLAHSTLVTEGLREKIGRLAPVMVFPGSLEMRALAAGAIRVLQGQEEPLLYRLP